MGIEKDVRFTQKKVDESWKNEINKQPAAPNPSRKEGSSTAKTSASAASETSQFMNLISSLGMQALIQMGAVEDPATRSKAQDYDGAKVTIDMLIMLGEKTHGNLDEHESEFLKELIYDLQMKFVQIQKQMTS